MAALVIKVGALALKALAKPLGERFQRFVLAHPTARGHVIRAAQARPARAHRAPPSQTQPTA